MVGVWHARKHHEKAAGGPSFAFFAKGGIRNGRYRDSRYPTLRKKGEGWGTRPNDFVRSMYGLNRLRKKTGRDGTGWCGPQT